MNERTPVKYQMIFNKLHNYKTLLCYMNKVIMGMMGDVVCLGLIGIHCVTCACL